MTRSTPVNPAPAMTCSSASPERATPVEVRPRMPRNSATICGQGATASIGKNGHSVGYP